MTITLYHNPRCSTSRSALALLREHGVEPHIIDYLQTPLSRDALAALIARSGLPVRDFLRRKEALYSERQLDTQDDEALLDALAAHPQLFNRPVASSEQGVRIGRPAERVLELLEEEK